MAQKVLITGASSGFGKLTVKTLLEKGHQVAATMRNIGGKNKDVAAELGNAGAKIIELDVTDEQSVISGVEKAIAELGGLDVLMNNAGTGTLGMQEFFTTEDYKKLFDVNVFGVQRMNRAAIPYFRKQNKGLIIYTTSLLGRIAMPFYGPYQSSKWALESMAENYRVELSTFGIENCIIEPGGYPTEFMDNLLKPSDSSRADSYGDFMQFPVNMFSAFEKVLKENPQQNPQRVADAAAELIEKPFGEKPFRTTVDFIGMGDAINKYNEHLDQLTTALYTNFGINGLLSVKK
jgi:NAD(P)-dependent dehydrogenase (short-subunit alcohol dehydrogenase family)